MKNNNLLENVSRSFHKVLFEVKKHSPAILVGAGVVGVVAGTVMACKATLKVNDILERTKEDVEKVHEAMNNPELVESGQYTEQDSKKDLFTIYARTGIEFTKLYGPSVVVGGLSIASILASYRILNARNVAISAAYTLVDKGFKDYRSRVKDRFGDRVDYELRHNIKAKTIETVEVDEKGNTVTETKTVDVIDDAPLEEYSVYSRFFDETSENWVRDSEYNLYFLKQCQRMANEKLRVQGYLFLNDVYKMLGLQESKAGQNVGWVYKEGNEIGDNYVDFGIHDVHKRSSREFVNGYEKSILLDFNVDGNITDILA